MAESYKYDWDPKEWQNFALQLIRERHGGANVQRVPDKDRGDSGMEAFTCDGCVYQCYAPEYTPDVSFRTQKIRAKLSRDVPKLIEHTETIKGFLGSIMVSRWILAVPLFDSKVVITTCSHLTERVVSARLPFVRRDFRVCVEDQSDFSSEIEQLRRKAALRVQLSPLDVTSEGLHGWQDQHIDLVKAMTEKLERGFPLDPKARVREKVDRYVIWHLQGANVLDQLRRDLPDVWDQVQAVTSNAEKKIETFGATGASAKDVIGNSVEELRTEITECMPGFHRSEIDKVAIGTAADWLMRCPLDF